MKKQKSYSDLTHSWGRFWMISAFAFMYLFPVVVCVYFDAWPAWKQLLVAGVGVVPTYWVVGVVENFTYIPMLGAGGSYLGFTTGNITNLKVPCALAAMEALEVTPGSEEGDVISTIAIAVSSIVTTVVVALFVLLMVPLTPIFESEALSAAFGNVVPALFGALGVFFFSKNWRIGLVPLVLVVIIFVAAPSLTTYYFIFIPVMAAVAILCARFMYNRGILPGKPTGQE